MIFDSLITEILNANIPTKKKTTYDYLAVLEQSNEDFTGLQPFIFSPSGEKIRDVEIEEKIIASPFPLFSIEIDDRHLTYSNDPNEISIKAIICREIGPDDYQFWMVIGHAKTNVGDHVICINKDGGYGIGRDNARKDFDMENYIDMYQVSKSLVNQYIDRLHKESTGTFNGVGRVKIKSKTGTKIYRPKNLIYVTPKKEQKTNEVSLGRKVNWSSAWTVRSHWRKLKSPLSVGKGRSGEKVLGFTWINDYVKGKGEIKNKVRKVK